MSMMKDPNYETKESRRRTVRCDSDNVYTEYGSVLVINLYETNVVCGGGGRPHVAEGEMRRS